MWLVVLFTCFLTYVIYYFCFKPYNYWKNRGIKYVLPLPLVGNFGKTVFKGKHPCEIYDYIYRKYSNQRYVGIYIFMKPALLLRDLNLIKKICVEEFDHFSDRVQIFDKKFDTVLGNGLSNLKGNEWKDARTTLNPIFNESIIKQLSNQITESAEAFSEYFVKEDKELLEIQLKDVFSRYDCDVISRIIFGVKKNSLEDKDNDFFTAYNELRSFGTFERLKLSIIQLSPFLAKILQIKVFPTSKTDIYKRLVLDALDNHKSENKNCDNLLSWIKNARNKESDTKETQNVEEHEPNRKDWTEEQIVAHALMFLNSHAGIEVFLSASCSLAYELAINPPIQVKLQEEIDKVRTSSNSPVTYEAICGMKYLDCVVSETLRKWPPIYQTDRECVKSFYEVELSVPDDEKIVIEKNTAVIVPIMAIHRDHNYYPQPDRFIPERFCEENDKKHTPESYMPFGVGSRSCIGSKIALLELKLLIFQLLSKFDLVPTINTKLGTEERPTRFDVSKATHNVLGLKPRKVTSL